MLAVAAVLIVILPAFAWFTRGVHSTKQPPQRHEMDSDTEAKILDTLRRDHKIEAIKLYRDHCGGSLKEAKNFVEGLS